MERADCQAEIQGLQRAPAALGRADHPGLPAERIGGENQSNYIRFENGADVAMMAFQLLKRLEDIQGHQYPEISVDECTNFPWFAKLLDKLRGANRSPHGVPTHLFCTGNPGGPGHLQVKEHFRLGTGGVKSGVAWLDEQDISRVFIQSFLRDNRILVEADPKYVRQLMGIKDPILRKAWLDGDWDVYIGQAFNITPRHILSDCMPPPYVAIYMTFDWGFGKPFSVGWWWVDHEDRIYRFCEWYGWNGVPDEGLRMEDSLIAEGIREREHKMGIGDRPIIRLAGPDCWNKKADYRGGGQGPSTAEVFRGKQVVLRPGDPSRVLKIRAMRERLVVPADPKKLPQLVVSSKCRHFLRTVPSLAMDDDNPEDIDTEQEDHVFDEACHIVMARAYGIKAEEIEKKVEAKAKEEKRAQLPTEQRHVWEELDRILEAQEEENERGLVMADFRKSMEEVFDLEGILSNHVLDAGRETCFGISRVYNPSWEGWARVDQIKEANHGFGKAVAISQDNELREMVLRFYKAAYWDPLRGDDNPSQRIATELMDTRHQHQIRQAAGGHVPAAGL